MEIIGKEIRKFTTFFTAEEAHEQIKKRDGSIGIATVYRYLNEIEGNNRPHLYYCNRKKLYSFNKNNHCHYICNECKKVSHFSMDKLNFLKENVKGKVCHFQLDVYGICDECASKVEAD